MTKTAKENLEEFTIEENMKTIQKYLDYFFLTFITHKLV